MAQLKRIVSGGQTGVDRAALDVAIELGIPHGGWCPAGRKAEDGRIPDKYDLQETEASGYAVRTERNVIDSDATLIVFAGRMTGGTAFTYKMARRHQRPCHQVNLESLFSQEEWLAETRRWLAEQSIGVLNVAGPRASSHDRIREKATEFLRQLFDDGDTIGRC